MSKVYAVVIVSNDGGSGHVVHGLEELQELLTREMGGPDPYISVEELARLQDELGEVRRYPNLGSWIVSGRDAWRERAYIGEVTE